MRASSASADQGENDCHGTMGNSALKTGYGCQMPAMVDLWRKTWSAEPGTTDPLAPFGIITLASGGSEGGSDIGGMRWSQTANFGVNPNPAMPASFVAQAYDIIRRPISVQVVLRLLMLLESLQRIALCQGDQRPSRALRSLLHSAARH